MHINDVVIEDTFAEAFEMWASQLIITAVNETWAMTAAQVATGFSTSIIACGCEAGIGGVLPREHRLMVVQECSSFSSPCPTRPWKRFS